MDDIHPNTLALMKINDEAVRLGYKGDFCRDVAYAMGEEGNEYPSAKAVLFAGEKLEKLKRRSK